MIQHNQITETDRKAWAEFVGKHPENTVFQSPEMFDFYKKVNNYNPHVFIAKNEENEICGVLLAVVIKEYGGWRGRLSSRAIVYGGPLTVEPPGGSWEVLKQLLQTLSKTLGKESVYIQLRNFAEWPEGAKEVFASYGYRFTDRLNLRVDTSDREKAERAISKSKLRQIKKGMAEGCLVRPPQSEEELKQFYGHLRKLYKERVRKPLPDYSFFKQFYQKSRQGKLGIIRLIISDNEVIGGVVAPVTPGKNIYEWYVFGMDERHRKKYPSVLATWAPIEYGLENKLQHFDFMGLGVPGKPYGVRDFKLHFGKNTTNPGRFSKINNRVLYFVTEIAYNILRLFNKV